MLDFSDIVILLAWLLAWLLAIAGVFFFTRWLLGFVSHFELEPDTRVLIIVSFVAVILLAVFTTLLNLGEWRSGYKTVHQPASKPVVALQPKGAQIDLETFEQMNYPQLYGLRKQMLQELAELEAFFQGVRDWGEQMPAHRPFLQKIIDLRWKQRQALLKAYQDIDQSRRSFWIHYNTGKDQYVREMFNSEAERLQGKIQDALGQNLDFRQDEEKLVRQHLEEAGDLLKQPWSAYLKIVPKGRKPAFVPYGEKNRQILIDWLAEQKESGVLTNLQQLKTEEDKIRERIAYIMEYRQLNKDLWEQVDELANEWNKTLIVDQYAQYRLLFAAEAMYAAIRLKTGEEQKELMQLRTQLREQAPDLVRQAIDERNVAEHSYQPEADRRYRKKN